MAETTSGTPRVDEAIAPVFRDETKLQRLIVTAKELERENAELRARTIEECANVCDILTMGGDSPAGRGAARCARAIRALNNRSTDQGAA